MNLEKLGWNPHFAAAFVEYEPRFTPARVAGEYVGCYKVYCKYGERTATVTGKFRHKVLYESEYPVVGDWVAIDTQPEQQTALIHDVLPRISKFSRQTAGRRTDEQVVAVNIDTLFLVCGLDRDFNLRRIERYLTLTWNCGAEPVILLNKADLCADVPARSSAVQDVAMGVPVHAISATQSAGLEPLRPYLGRGKTVSMLGSSGVGKSTLINQLLASERQKVDSVRPRDGRGKHTTTNRELILLPAGGVVIDNPGMRELQLWGDAADVSAGFEDIEELANACQFTDCQHTSEPACAVRGAVESGRLDAARLQSYFKLTRELQYAAFQQDGRTAMLERMKWKKIAVNCRVISKSRHRLKYRP